MAGLHFDITGDNANFLRKLDEARNGVRSTSKQIEESGVSIEQMFGRLAKGAAAFGAGITVKEIVSNTVRVRGEFQQLEVAFKTMLGSEEQANTLMGQLVNTAAKTPFDLQGVANGAKQLLAYGTSAEDVNGTLVRLGDIAAGLSIPLGDLVYLYGTTMTQGRLFTQDLRQFQGRGIPLADELAKQFGVAKDKVGELVTAGKVGFPEVQKAIEAMTNDGGKFGGLMEAQSKTITGQISNIEDSIATMYNNIGKQSEGFINDALSGVSYLVENYEEIGKTVLELAAVYGAYKAVLITITALQKVNSMVLRQAAVEKRLAAAAGIALSNAEAVAAAQTKILTIAQVGLTKAVKSAATAMLANPYVLIAAAIAGVSFAIYKVATAETELDKAHQRLNDATKDVEKNLSTEVSKLTSLERKLTETKKGTEEYNSIKKTIVDNYGQYYKGLDGEIERVGNLSTVYGKLVEAMRLSIGQRKFESFFKTEQDNLDKTIGEKLDKAYDTLIEKYGKDKGGKLYQQVFDYAVRGNTMATDTWNQINAATFKEWGFDNSPVGFSVRSVASLMNDVNRATQSSNIALDKFKEKYQITEEEVAKILSGDFTSGDNPVENKTLKQLVSDIAAAKLELKSLQEQANRGLIGSDKVKEQSDALAKLTSDYKLRTGKEYNSNSQDSQAEKLIKKQEKYNLLLDKQKVEQIRAEEDRWNQVWQAQIDAMDEGSEKTLSQMELSHERELQAIDREKEDLLRKKYDEAKALFDADEAIKAQKTSGYKPQSFDGSGVVLSPTESAQFDSKYKSTLDKQAKERQAYYASEKQAMNKYLAEYGEYMQKRQAIVDLYNERIAKATTKGEKLSLGEEMKKSLASVDDEVQKKTPIITKLFSDMNKRTVADMRAIADEAQAMLDYVNGGEFKTDDSGKGMFGLTKEQFDILSKSPEKLQAIKDEIANVLNEADNAETSFNKMANGLDKVFSSGKDTNKLKEGLEELEEGFNDVIRVGEFLSDTISNLGEAFGNDTLQGIADGINVAMDAAKSAMQGAKAGSIFGPIGAAAGAAIGLVGSLASSFAKIHDAKNEKRIQRLQDQIEVLEKSYDKLGDSIEKAYSKDASKLIEQNNQMLEQQKVLIQNQIREEQDKKKTDDGRIKEWQNQIEEINKLIDDNKEKAIDVIFGEDLKSSIDNFAQAYANAWTSGEDKAKSAKDTVRDMMRQMVTESIKAAIQSSGKMEEIRNKLKQFYADNVLSGWEQDYIYNMADNLQKELDNKFGWADGLMKDEKATSQDSTKGGFEAMSQDTGNEINGRFTAFQISNEEISSMLSMLASVSLLSVSVNSNGITLIEIRNLMISSNSYLEDIAKYTKLLIDCKKELETIKNNTKSL